MAEPLLQLGVRDVLVTDDSNTIDRARAALEASWFVRVPRFLDDAALNRTLHELRSGDLRRFEHAGIGLEQCFVQDTTFARLELLLNDPRVLRLAAALAGVPRVGCFIFRIYRVIPGAGHYDQFHNDLDDGRVLALTLNLSEATYRGSTLEMRRRDAAEVVEVPNTTPGDAVLFRLGEDLQHRISDIEGDVPKTALAGWFCSYPEFDQRLLARVKRSAPTR